SFVSSGVLKNHIKTHEGVRAFSCTLCHLSFTTNGSLTRHMATHTTARPYMCPYCRKTFKTSVSCRKHIKTHRDEVLASNVVVSSVTTALPIINPASIDPMPEVSEPRIDGLLQQEMLMHATESRAEQDPNIYVNGHLNASYNHESHYADYGNTVINKEIPSNHLTTENVVIQGIQPNHIQTNHHLMNMPNDCMVNMSGPHVMLPNEMISSSTIHTNHEECHGMNSDPNVHLHYSIPCPNNYSNVVQDHNHQHLNPAENHGPPEPQLVMNQGHQTFEN
ncbi:unnamed protein product, partial [Allacma fusca]